MAHVIGDKTPLSAPEEQKVADDITRSRIQMLMAFPFFGILSLNLQLEQDYNTDTAATDGKSFFYNPNFIKSLDEGERNWVVVHEVLHPALKHLWRQGDRQHEKWNYACDYAIHDIMKQFVDNASNSQLKEKLKMPKSALYDKRFENKSAEEIYDELPDYPGHGAAAGTGVLDDHGNWGNNETQGNAQAKAQQWEGKMMSAAKAAEGKAAGNVPAFLQRLLNKLTRPQKDWRTLLNEFVQPEIDDYSWNPPDKRYSDSDFFLPDFNGEVETVKKILFFCDTSGSIGDKELNAAYSEAVGAIQQFNGKLSGWLGFFDHAVYGPWEFESVEDILAIRPVGGGGTSFDLPLKYVAEEMEDDEVAGIIMVTDGYASWPDEKITKGIPVLWLIVDTDVTPPWGLHATLKV